MLGNWSTCPRVEDIYPAGKLDAQVDRTNTRSGAHLLYGGCIICQSYFNNNRPLHTCFQFVESRLRFSDLETELDIAPTLLSTRLHDVIEAGFLERDASEEVPPRVEYPPTEKAASLFQVFPHLHQWAIAYER